MPITSDIRTENGTRSFTGASYRVPGGWLELNSSEETGSWFMVEWTERGLEFSVANNVTQSSITFPLEDMKIIGEQISQFIEHIDYEDDGI